MSWLLALPILLPVTTAVAAFLVRERGRAGRWVSVIGCALQTVQNDETGVVSYTEFELFLLFLAEARCLAVGLTVLPPYSSAWYEEYVVGLVRQDAYFGGHV